VAQEIFGRVLAAVEIRCHCAGHVACAVEIYQCYPDTEDEKRGVLFLPKVVENAMPAARL
jgi:hypothetical protein